jgi:hypothetical protein
MRKERADSERKEVEADTNFLMLRYLEENL